MDEWAEHQAMAFWIAFGMLWKHTAVAQVGDSRSPALGSKASPGLRFWRGLTHRSA